MSWAAQGDLQARLTAGTSGTVGDRVGPTPRELAELAGWLQGTSPSTADAEAIDRIVALDRLVAAVAGATHGELTAFADSAVARHQAAGVSTRRLGEGVAEQVALARRISPVTAARQVNHARRLTQEMPCTYRLLSTGEVSDLVTTLVVRESRELSCEDRATLDEELAGSLTDLSPREAEAAARWIAYRVDPDTVMRRSAAARADRRVSIRPAPDTMALLSGLLPVEQGVTAWAALDATLRPSRPTVTHAP